MLILSPEALVGNNMLRELKLFFVGLDVNHSLYSNINTDTFNPNKKNFSTTNKYDANNKEYSVFTRNKTILNAITTNNLEVIQFFGQEMLQRDPQVFLFNQTRNAYYYASKHGRFEILQYLMELTAEVDVGNINAALYAAPFSHSMDLLQYVAGFANDWFPNWHNIWNIEHNPNRNRWTPFDSAVIADRMDMFVWLETNRPKDLTFAQSNYNAIQYGRINFLQYLSDREAHEFPTNAINIAAKFNRFDIAQWIHLNKPNSGATYEAFWEAAKNGSVEFVQWIHNNTTAISTFHTMDLAAKNGHLEVLKWLHNNRTEGCSSNAMDYAAENNHIEVVEWLHLNTTHGCTTNAMDNAFQNKHYDMVSWLRKNRNEGCSKKYKNHINNLIEQLNKLNIK